MSLPFMVGDHGAEITAWQNWFKRAHRLYAPPVDGHYGDDAVTAVKQMQHRLGLSQTGVFDANTAHLAGFSAQAANLPIMFTVEGHTSNMFAGPVADTATALEAEGRCHHQPIGYNNAAVPFDNSSGINELARLVTATVMDNGVPFPQGTPWSLGGYSQGAIVVSDFYFDHLAPGKPLAWRTPDLRGVLAYGNPCRQTDSIATWAPPISQTGTHGLDPYRRFGLPNYPAKPDNWVDVYREGDIFAENGDDRASEIKAAVYQAVARSDVFSNPYSVGFQIAEAFKEPVLEIVGIIQAIISGVEFLQDPSSHYSPYEIAGGIDWMRGQLSNVGVGAAAANDGL